MKKKSFALGFGLALILFSIVSYLLYSFQYKELERKFSVEAPHDITDEEIIQKARNLGMDFKPTVQSTPKTENTPPPAAAFVPEAQQPETVSPSDMPTETAVPVSQVSEAPIVSPAITDSPERKSESDDGSIIVYISQGLNAKEISRLLESRGVIGSAADFEIFLINMSVTTVLPHGNFVFSEGLSFEEILEILIDSE